MINKLLTLLLNEVKKNGVKYGLCSIITNLYFNNEISWSKFRILKRYIDKHRPIYKYNILFGWRKSVKAPRIRWLKEHIRGEVNQREKNSKNLFKIIMV